MCFCIGGHHGWFPMAFFPPENLGVKLLDRIFHRFKVLQFTGALPWNFKAQLVEDKWK